MYIVSVIPLLSGISKDTLTYSSKRALALGSVVAAPFRNKTIDCIVVERRSIREAKSDLRRAEFSIKKISETALERRLLPENYIKTLLSLARYYAIPYSQCFSLLLPKSILSAPEHFNIKSDTLELDSKLEYKEIALQNTLEYYDQEPARGVRVIVVPTVERANYLQSNLRCKNIIVLHSGITQKKQIQILSESNTIKSALYICTPQFIVYFRMVEKIYLDNFSSSHYVSSTDPYISARLVLIDYCPKISSEVVVVDALVMKEVVPPSNFSFNIIDMTDSVNGSKYIWQSSYLEKLLAYNKANGKRTLLYVHRKGLSAYLSCNDCKLVVTCSCSTPFTLFSDQLGSRRLRCHLCKNILHLDPEIPLSCKSCGSWKLQGYGVSTEAVHNDLKTLGFDTFIIDSEYTKTPKAIKSEYSNFCSTPGSVLVATELCFDYLTNDIDSVCVVSIDSQILIQDYNTDAKVLRKIINLASYSKTPMYVQTRLPRAYILKINNIKPYLNWKKEYLSDLQKYNLPPSGVSLSIVKKGYFNDQEKDVIKNALIGQAYTYDTFRGLSFVKARVPNNVWGINENLMAYKISLLRSTCDVFIE